MRRIAGRIGRTFAGVSNCLGTAFGASFELVSDGVESISPWNYMVLVDFLMDLS